MLTIQVASFRQYIGRLALVLLAVIIVAGKGVEIPMSG